MRFMVRILAGAVALAAAAWLIDGISVGPGTTSERVLTCARTVLDRLGLPNPAAPAA